MSVGQEQLLREMTPHAREHARWVLAHVRGLTLTSTRRSARRNRAVGGVPNSFHLTGRAADFSGSAEALAAGAAYARKSRIGPRCTGPEEVLIHDSGSGVHLHVAW